jgi:prevent-host-death family protein
MIYMCNNVASMDEVGIRELRQNPGPVLRAVEAGGEVIVSISRRPVARIVPIDATTWVSAEQAERIYSSAPVDPEWANELRASREQDEIRDPWS